MADAPLPSVDQLLLRVAAGDRSAFTDLYDSVAPLVVGIARKVVRDPSRAEEIAHDALVDVWRRAPRFDPSRGSATGWIGTITRRRAIDVVRAEQASRNRELKVTESAPPPLADPVADIVTRADEHARVRAALNGLTDLEREAIDLAYFGGLTYRQVSERLAVPLGTVKTRMRSALARLGGLLEGQDD